MRINTYRNYKNLEANNHFAVLRYINTPAISVTVVMKGEDIKAGSNLILSNSKGRIAPVVAANVVIEIRLIPTAEAIKGPSPCHQAKGNTTSIINTPKRAPVIASLTTAFTAPRDFNFCVLKPLMTTVEL